MREIIMPSQRGGVRTTKMTYTENCRIHPGYRGVGKPRSTKAGCTCQEIYVNTHAK